MDHVNSVVILLVGLLCAVAAVAGLARRFAVSYPIALVVFGLLCSLIPRVPDFPLPPSFVFIVILPPLLYIAAWQTSWQEFKYNLVSISSLAVFLVFFTAIGVAFAAQWWLPGFDWQLGFLLGAVVSPTDAVAATSIARKVGMPQAIVDVLEGESLINDATGLLALQFGVQMVVERTAPSMLHGTLDFLWLTVGGVLVGVLIGFTVTWLERWVDDGPVEIALSLIIPYVAYLAADAIHASGVIAVVSCGLLVSRQSSRIFSPRVRLQTLAVWDAVEFLLNGFVFILLGLQLPHVLAGIQNRGKLSVLVYALVFSAVLIVLRMVWMFPAARASWWVRTRFAGQIYEMPRRNQLFVLGWTGMRGVVALAAANSLPLTLADGRPFPERDLIIFLTFSVIVVTIVFQGSSLPFLIRRLGLAQVDSGVCEEGEARRLLLHAAIGFLQERGQAAGEEANRHLYEDLLHQYEHKLTEVDPCGPDGSLPEPSKEGVTLERILLDTVRRERAELNTLRANGRIGDTLYRTLEHELDLSESRLD
ncbi:Na+/H+ antiporter [Occallatibacter riparius]|uniref:Na+/H+ antiporter n=1 Tax=Occallatibacter riparius TaxID=1002689 RepID=A0A9J7BVQ3_9BACT|nr:Na+/H+ antiporter [Occallatibacter riparius]UWZ84974.1 Na+/H+ antiporter [Occallatibacter riparius]